MTPVRPRLILAAALLLPLMVLAAIWAITDRQARQGQEWLIPIAGYDPRDLLRGHYVRYRHVWPTPPDVDAAHVGQADALCVTGIAPHIRTVRPISPPPDGPGPDAIQGCAIVLRATTGARREIRGLDSGIFFASQPQAIALSQKLADPALQRLIRVRVRADGLLRPVALEFRPRPAARMGR